MTDKLETTYDLFLHDLRAVLYLERMLVEELDNMAGEVTNDELAEALRKHGKETEGQVERVESVFETLGENMEEHEAADYKGIFEEADHLNRDIMEAEMVNVAFLNTAVKIERVEMTAYEGLLRMANNLKMTMPDEDFDKVADLLRWNHKEEEDALERLQDIGRESWMEKLIRRLTP